MQKCGALGFLTELVYHGEKEMKYLKILYGLCLCTLLLFSGCGQSGAQTAASQAVPEKEVVSQAQDKASEPSSLRMLTPVDGVYITTGMGTQEGYYLLEAQESGGQNMKYIDFATAKLIYLSNDPSALHTTEADTSWMEQSASFLFVLNEKLYCTATDFSGATVVFEMSPTGSDRRQVLKLPGNLSMKRGLATDGVNLYTTLDAVNEQMQLTSALYCLSPQTGEVTLLQELGEADLLYGADGNSLYFKCTDVSDGQEGLKAESTLKAYSLENKNFETIFSWPEASNCGAIRNGCFYYFTYEDGTLYALDLTTKEAVMLAQNLPSTGSMDGIYFDDIRDNHFVYWLAQPSAEPDKTTYQTYGVDLTSGKCAAVTLHGGLEEGEYLPVVWETENEFLVQYSREPEKVMLTAPDGSQYESETLTVQYALIQKDDFWQNKPNYRLVERT